MIHQPERDPATPNIRQSERQQIAYQTIQYLDAGNSITTLPSCKASPLLFRWSEKAKMLVDARPRKPK
jgi:hypothetical protein